MPQLPSIWEEPFKLMSNVGKMLDGFHNSLSFGTGYGRTDIYEKDGELHYDIELPGLTKDDISAKIEENTLVVKGEIKRDESISEDNYLLMERRYGSFQKCFSLPPQVDKVDKMKAKFEDGILKITIPLKETLRGKVVDIEIE